MKFLLYCAILLSTMLQSECAPKSAKLSDLITCGPNVEGLAPCEDARDQLEVAAPVTPKKHESESVPKRESGRVKRQVPPSETETELPGTEQPESTGTEQEHGSQEGTSSGEGTGSQEVTEASIDVSGYARFKGGWRMRSSIRKCKEPKKMVDGIVSKCNIPFMCKTEQNDCISFFDVEYMFENFHNANDFGDYGAWDEDVFQENIKNIEDYELAEKYTAIENKKYGDPELFQTLAEMVDDGNDKIVTISLGNVDTDVSPTSVCNIVNWAPFKSNFIDQRRRKCPAEN